MATDGAQADLGALTTALQQMLHEQQQQRAQIESLSQAVQGTGTAVQATQAVTEQVVTEVVTQVQAGFHHEQQQSQEQLTQVGTILTTMQEQMQQMGQALQQVQQQQAQLATGAIPVPNPPQSQGQQAPVVGSRASPPSCGCRCVCSRVTGCWRIAGCGSGWIEVASGCRIRNTARWS